MQKGIEKRKNSIEEIKVKQKGKILLIYFLDLLLFRFLSVVFWSLKTRAAPARRTLIDRPTIGLFAVAGRSRCCARAMFASRVAL